MVPPSSDVPVPIVKCSIVTVRSPTVPISRVGTKEAFVVVVRQRRAGAISVLVMAIRFFWLVHLLHLLLLLRRRVAGPALRATRDFVHLLPKRSRAGLLGARRARVGVAFFSSQIQLLEPFGARFIFFKRRVERGFQRNRWRRLELFGLSLVVFAHKF